MSKCNIKNCSYYSYVDSDKCFEHSHPDKFRETHINKTEVFKRFDDIIKNDIINLNQEKNIISLLKSVRSKDFDKLINILCIYTKSINKKFITANLARFVTKYCSTDEFDANSKIIHTLYPLVRDFWNIDNTHHSTALCYYGEHNWLDVTRIEKCFFDQEPRMPNGYLGFKTIFDSK